MQLGLGLLVFGLLFGARLSRRASTQPFGYWPLAWAVLTLAGINRFAEGPREIEDIAGIVFSTLMLAGVLRYADRDVPRSLFLAATGIAAIYLAFDLAGLYSVTWAFSLFVEPLIFLAAVFLAHRAARRRKASALHRFVAPGLLVLLLMDLWDAAYGSSELESIGVWLAVSIPVATIQAVVMFDRIRSVADEAAEALEQSVSLLQATLESTADGIQVVDQSGKYTSFNRSFRQMWRVPSSIPDRGKIEVVLNFAMQQLEDPQAFYYKAMALYSDPGAESFDTLRFKDGRVFERYSRPQRVGDQIVGRVWSFRDVTERARAEAVALRHQNHLEELVEERTRELLASRDRLRQADRLVAVGTLAAGIAHQINNPVGSILNSAEYALMCEQDPDAMEIFKQAMMVNAAEARRCAVIVRSMLQFAREEPIAKRVEDINQVVRRACGATANYARQRGAEVDEAFSNEPLPVDVSPIEIDQAFVNLLRNAIESSDRDVRVSVRSERKGDLARIHLADNGCGIEPENLSRIFDPFFSTRLREGGTGLGLSVAHGIVSEHGGEIRVTSECGKGTEVVVELPISTDTQSHL